MLFRAASGVPPYAVGRREGVAFDIYILCIYSCIIYTLYLHILCTFTHVRTYFHIYLPPRVLQNRILSRVAGLQAVSYSPPRRLVQAVSRV